jgi:hypothetical protein
MLPAVSGMPVQRASDIPVTLLDHWQPNTNSIKDSQKAELLTEDPTNIGSMHAQCPYMINFSKSHDNYQLAFTMKLAETLMPFD